MRSPSAAASCAAAGSCRPTAIDEIDTGSRVIGLSVVREQIRKFL